MTNGSSASTSDYDLWHWRFRNSGKKSVEELPGKVKGVSDCITAPANPKPCDGCKFRKSKHAAFPLLESWTDHLLNLIYMDLVEYPVQSINGYCYTLTTLDDHSSFGLTWFLKHKSDTLAAFKQFIYWAECQSDHKLKSICSDQGGEFLGHEFDEYLAEYGIEHQLSVVHSLQQNRRAER
jgi:transposase InsO family protein